MKPLLTGIRVFTTVLMSLAAAAASSQTGDDQPSRPFGALLTTQTRQTDDATAQSDRAVEDALNERPRILGGIAVAQGKYRWAVAFGYFKNNVLVQYCGGTIVAPGWILTAAHCPLTKDDAVIAGTTSLVGVHSASAVIKGVFRGPYDEKTRSDDYALVRLDRDLGISKIDEVNTNAALEINDGTPLIIAGWGRTSADGRASETLREASIKTYEAGPCGTSYKMGRPSLALTPTMFCAAAVDRDACQGDSGGPAFQQIGTTKPARYRLFGIVSWGKDCGMREFPGVYTRMSVVQPWMAKTMQKCPKPLPTTAPAANVEKDPCWNI